MDLNLGYAVRQMRRSPATAAIALASIAIGTSAAGVVFAAVKSVLIEPFPYAHAENLVVIRTDDSRANPANDWVSWSDMRDAERASTAIAAWGSYRYAVFNLAPAGNSLPESLYGVTVSASLFPTLGVTPMLGRNILPEEDQPNHSCVTILSYGLWARKFNFNRQAIGESIEANGRACTIVGVMPAEFAFPLRLATTVRTPSPYIEFWAAPSVRPDPDLLVRRADFGYGAVARLKPGATATQASAELGRISADLARQYPLSNQSRYLRAVPLVERNLGASRAGLVLLFGAAGLFLLVGCANVANLLLARGLERQREFAIRYAVGADRAAIVRQLLTETCLLALAGGLAGFALTALAWKLLPAVAPMTIPRLAAARADAGVFVFTVAIALLSGAICGILPALRSSVINSDLRGSGSRGGWRSALVSAEAALAVVLVVVGSVLAGALIHLLRTDTGFDARRVLASIIVPVGEGYKTPESRESLWPKVLDAVVRIPGVESAGTVDQLPFSGENGGPEIFAQPGGPAPIAEVDTVSAGYLPAMGVKLLNGRWFRDDDVTRKRSVAMVDEIAARRLWPRGAELGQRICVGCEPGQQQHWYEVIGVVGSLRHASLDQTAGPAVYLTLNAFQKADFLVVRSEHPTAALAEDIRRAVASADPNQPVLLSATMATLIGDSIADRRFVYVTLIITGVLALALAIAGVYGVVSHATSRRGREIGIRMAIGATPVNVMSLILRQGMRPVIIGIAAGVAGAAAVIALARSQVEGLAGASSRMFVLAVALVAIAAAAACWLPARRAAKLDPARTLRQE